MAKVGMVGIGLMGHGIASNLVKHGHELTVLEHPGNQPLDALKAAGATSCADGATLAARSDVIILCVTGSPQVEAVLLSPGGVLEGLRPGAVVIDCSTAIPSSTQKVAQAVTDKGGRFLDAPMTRTPKEAAEGRLNLLVGGDAALFAECRPLLACFAENISHAGPVGAGHRMKLLHNYVSLGVIALLSEAAACAARRHRPGRVRGRAGQGRRRRRGAGTPQALSAGTGSLVAEVLHVERGKDLSYYNTMAQETGAARDIGQAVLDTYAQAVKQGGGERYVPELVSLLQEGAAR